MSARASTRLAWTLWGLVIAFAAASLVLRLWNNAALGSSVTGAERLSEFLWWVVLIPALVPAYATVGAIVAWRRPTNGVGWLCLALGMLVALEAFSVKLRDETDLDRLTPELLRVVQETMQPGHVSLWLRPPHDVSRSTVRGR